jgi:hypothetical protein
MTIDRASLQRAIGARKLADWVITERKSERMTIGSSGSGGSGGSSGSGGSNDELWRSETSDHLRVLVRRDLPSGRGTGVVELQEHIGDAPSLIARAVALAEAAVEPAWDTPPPAAPARVELLDALAARSLEPAATALRTALYIAATAAGLTVQRWHGQVTRDDLLLSSAQGFDVTWQQSSYQLNATLAGGPSSGGVAQRVSLRGAARRLAELDLGPALVALAKTAAAEARALMQPGSELPTGPVILELGPEAMLGDARLGDGGAASGVWGAFVALATTRAARRGLPRGGREEPELLRSAPGTPSSLTVWSDGALPYGLRSAPVGEEGEAVRRFRLFAEGAVGEPGMGPREAALRGGAPNGGVRNLVVNAGERTRATAATAGSDAAPVLEVRRLRLLRIDPSNGHAELELGLAVERTRGTVLRGGCVALDLVQALATAERAPEQIRRGDYQGPAWIRLGPVQLR